MRAYNKQEGRSLISWIALTPFMLAGLIIIGVLLCEANKAYWDHKVKGMCEEDGEFEIFEQIEVTTQELSKLQKLGKGIGFRDKKFAIPSDIIFSETKDTVIQSVFLRVEYSEVTIKRLTDEKIIARYITAVRIGGDFPSPAHSSSYRCPSSEALGIEVKKIFKRKEINNDEH